ncbi:MAG: acyl-CoA dehydrogenase domain-containing protein, partial [Waterburya sp.]
LIHWSMQYAFAQIQQGFSGILDNMSVPLLGIVATWWRLNPISRMPADKLGSKVAEIMQTPGIQRDNLTKDIYLPTNTKEALGRLENACSLAIQAEFILKKIKTAIKEDKLPQNQPVMLIRNALEAEIISLDEVELLTQAESACNDAIGVDSFTLAEYQGDSVTGKSPKIELNPKADQLHLLEQ